MFFLFAGPVSPESWSLPLMGVVDNRYRYSADLQLLESCTPLLSRLPVTWPLCPTPVSTQNLLPFLSQHPDQDFAHYIHNGFAFGFRIGFDRSRTALRANVRNHPSSLENPAVLRGNINSEVAQGRMIGPLPPSWAPVIHCSPLGLIPKSQPGKWRTIVDLSSPSGGSVNDGIDPSTCSLAYASLDNAVELIISLGRGAELVKMDLKDAYRIVPVHPQDHHLLAIEWDGAMYVDRCLPFGLRSAPKIFTAVADSFTWALYCQGVRYVMHYLDDFLLVGPPGTSEASAAADLAASTLRNLGVPIAPEKTEGPSIPGS